MVTIRRAEIGDAAYIAEGIFSAFLLEDGEIDGGGSLHQKWMETLTDICAQTDTHYSYNNTFIAEVNKLLTDKN